MTGPGEPFDDDSFDRYLDEVANAPALSLSEEQSLAGAASAGDEEAAARLVRSSLRLVVALARRYAATGVPLIDLVQEGNLALVHAVESFDPGRGFAFRSYATWLVRRALADVITKPDNDADLARLQEAWDSFVAHAGHQPSLADLATETGLTEDDVADLLGRPPDDTRF